MIEPGAQGVVITVKAVPGASRDQVVGQLGGALKIKVAAPPEAGKANKAICKLIAAALGVAVGDVSVVSGHTQPHKRIEVVGVTPEHARRRLAPA